MKFDRKKIEELLNELKNNKDMEDKIAKELLGYLHKMSIKELTEFYKASIESRAKHIEFITKIFLASEKSLSTLLVNASSLS